MRLLYKVGFYSRAAFTRGQLLLEGGLYAMFWVCKTGKSDPEPVKWKYNLTLRVLQNSSKCKQAILQAKNGRI